MRSEVCIGEWCEVVMVVVDTWGDTGQWEVLSKTARKRERISKPPW